METRTPEMRQWIMDANEKEFRGFLIDKIYDNKMAVTEQYNELREDNCVTLINGDKRKIKNNVAIAEMHGDIKEIRENTKWFTKPKIFFAVLIFILSQAFIFGVWKGTTDAEMESVKEVMIDIKDDMHITQEDIKEILRDSQ